MFFHSVVIINELPGTLFWMATLQNLNAAIAFMVAYIKTYSSQQRPPRTAGDHNSSLHSLIPCAQDGSLCIASWTPNPREAAGQLLAGKHQCNYSAWTLRVKKLTHISQTAQPYVAELLCWHLPPSISASPSMQ